MAHGRMGSLQNRSAYLAAAVKAVRVRRGMRSADLAARLGLPQRTYEYFESGCGHPNLERLDAVAEALDADAHAIRIAMEIGSPAFANRCADNKLGGLLTYSLQDFDAAAGDDIALLDPQTLMSAFDELFRQLTEIARHRRRLIDGGPPEDPPRDR